MPRAPPTISNEATRRLTALRNALQPALNEVGAEFTLNIALIKKAYRKKALLCHPDKGGNPEQFKALTNATEKIVKAVSNFLLIFPEAGVNIARG